ncbi:MAG: PEP-CTERM sorting domain-containing protein [Chthoniobacterales bacterium]
MKFSAIATGFVVAISVLVGVGSTRAALVLQLDPTASTIAFTGSDFGTTNSNSGVGRVDWSSPATLSDGSSRNLAIGGAFDAGTGIAFSPDSFFRLEGGSSRYVIELYTNNAGEQTISGNESTVSYNGWTPSQKADLENFVATGGELALSFGGAFTSVGTQVVPEPSAVAMLGLGAAFGGIAIFVRRRRRVCA